jgi:hypothetical protein
VLETIALATQDRGAVGAHPPIAPGMRAEVVCEGPNPERLWPFERAAQRVLDLLVRREHDQVLHGA